MNEFACTGVHRPVVRRPAVAVALPPTTTPPAAPPTTSDSQSMPGNSTTDEYAAQSAEFLNDDPAVAEAVGGDIIGVVCKSPSLTSIGTNFLCFGEAATFGPIEFSVEINAIESFLVTDFRAAQSPTKIILVDELVIGLTGEDLLADQLGLRQIVDGLPDTDARAIVDNIDAPQFLDGLSVDEDVLTTLLIDCVST